MDRLTKRADYNCACWNGNRDYTIRNRYLTLLETLARYEDTGLTPDEIAALHEDNDRLCAALKLAQARAGDYEAEVERLRAGVSEADELVCRLIERYEFDRPSDEANPCEWCSGNNCDSCRRMTDDDDHKIRFEMADLRFLEAARAALVKEADP